MSNQHDSDVKRFQWQQGISRRSLLTATGIAAAGVGSLGFIRPTEAAPNQLATTSANFTNVVFYVTAHQDDSFLFCGECLYRDLNAGANVKVVSVFVTAGDAGLINGWWQAREVAACAALATGSLNASSKAADRTSPPINLFGPTFTSEQVVINGHPIQKYSFLNSVIYFMRLPEHGFENYQELTTPLTAIDNSTTYANWSDFVLTLQTLLAQETASTQNANPWVNASDYHRILDPNDHPAHYAVADALRPFAAQTYNRAWWVSYDTRNRAANLSGNVLYQKRTLYYNYVYTFGARAIQVGCHVGANIPVDMTYIGNLTADHWGKWGSKSYCRTIPHGQPDNRVNPDYGHFSQLTGR